MSESCFQVLGLTGNESPSEIKKAYYAKAAESHPDGGGDAGQFHATHQAYLECLQIATTRPCPDCKGTKRVTANHGWASTTLPCPKCQGGAS